MYSLWLIIPILIAVGVFGFKKDKNRFNANFYNNLSNSQLKYEAIIILNKLLKNLDEKTKFIYTFYKDLNHLKSEINKLIEDLEKNNIDDLFQKTLIQNQNYFLLQLAKENKWLKNEKKLIKDLDLIIIEISIRKGDLTRNYHS